MSEHYFVVKFSTENGWEWDTETETAHFPDGTIYSEKEGWRKSGDLYNTPIYDNDETLSENLGQAMRIMNQVAGIVREESK